MSTKRIRHTAKFKLTIALEAIKSDKAINQLASEHQLHPIQISQWKKQLLEQGSDIFAITPTKRQREQTVTLLTRKRYRKLDYLIPCS